MKVLILASVHDSSVSRIKFELEKHKEKPEVEVISPADLYAFISSTTAGHDSIYSKRNNQSTKILSKSFDAIVPRFAGKELFEHGCMLVQHINENMKKFSTVTAPGLRWASNKFTTCQIFSANHLRTPKQVLSFNGGDFKEIIDLVGGLPAVGKGLTGSKGSMVFWMDGELSASTTLKSFAKSGIPISINQFIDSGHPRSDLRVFVVGPELKEPKVFAYKRFALDADFRSNYSISGSGEKVKLTDEERQMAIDAAKIFRLGVSGVDILRDAKDNNKPYLIEINGNPGLSGVEAVTGENVAGAIADYVMNNYKKGGKSLSAKSYFDMTDIMGSYLNPNGFFEERIKPFLEDLKGV